MSPRAAADVNARRSIVVDPRAHVEARRQDDRRLWLAVDGSEVFAYAGIRKCFTAKAIDAPSMSTIMVSGSGTCCGCCESGRSLS